MNILLIDNRTDYLGNVKKALTGHEVEVQRYKPGLNFHYQGKDLVILSGGGGEGFELKDVYRGKLWYEDEMNFVLSCPKPIIGICMGFEVISAAYGAKVKELPKLIKGFHKSRPTAYGRQQLAQEELNQFEWHRYGVEDVPTEEFDILADSDTGIEMITHKRRPIVATQFHPEIEGGSLQLASLLGV